MSDKCIRCDWGTALGTAYCAPCLSILVALEHGEQPAVDDPLDAPPERAILQDLIAGLLKTCWLLDTNNATLLPRAE